MKHKEIVGAFKLNDTFTKTDRSGLGVLDTKPKNLRPVIRKGLQPCIHCGAKYKEFQSRERFKGLCVTCKDDPYVRREYKNLKKKGHANA